MADLNMLKLISNAQIDGKVAPIKSITKACVSFTWLSTSLFIDREIHKTIPPQFPRCFSVF